MDKSEAQSALDAVKDTDRLMAQRMTWPLWRHAIFGVMMALLLLALALPVGMQIPVIGLVLLLVVLVVRDDKKRHGMFVSGYQKGRTGWVLAAQAALLLAALVVTLIWLDEPLENLLFWAMAATLLVVSTVLSVIWEKVYRADLEEGRA